MSNPLATTEQREVEDTALRLMQHPRIQKARSVVTLLWRSAVGYPAREQMDRFDNMIEEYVFSHVFRAANSDGAHPRVARFMAPAHHWFGRDVPGSRWGGDSPDFIYRIIPIEHGGHYEIHGERNGDEAPFCTYALMGDNTAAPSVQELLDSVDMSFQTNGQFVITLDPGVAEGRSNHIQTQAGADHLLVRDALGDWLTQSANTLHVKLRGGASGSPQTADALAMRAAKAMLESFYYTYFCTRSGFGLAPNQIRAPSSSAAFGGMATQWSTKANLWLEQDDALLIKANAAGALFRNVMLSDAFHLSVNYASALSSLNMRQMAPDEDGSFTYVVAHQDPGIHNWLDTTGLRQTNFGQRWQAFAPGYDGEAPALSARVVAFDRLQEEIPGGAPRIDREGRRKQMADRKAGFDRRFVDN
ncbi:MAG TPA: hypothetical protein VHZ99_06585 [Steroidobacteraceae bacterium]|jgi:hypothetical protein|nr:hypothetical protein [Steroidobacteraceae bacterium]